MSSKELTFEEALDIALTQRQIDHARGVRPTKITRKQVEEGLMEAFELIGGIPRLAMWANNPANYGEFIKIYAKMIPKEEKEDAGNVFVYQSNVPPSSLNKKPALTRIDDEASS